MLPRPASTTLRLAFLLSGCSALLFETLWFRQAGLVLGNAVWTSTIVLGAFMAGLAAGNALAAFRGQRVRDPVVAYAILELVVGLTGLGLVVLLPRLNSALVPLLHAALPRPALLNILRLLIAFLLLLVPATAMGATLPLLVRAPWPGRFGHTLGQLYGWNTLGAVLGTLLGEFWLIDRLGVKGTGIVAAALNVSAAAIVGALARSGLVAAGLRPMLLKRGRALLAAAFGAGGALLALEVVWFRFLLLNVTGTSRSFAVMLAIVLLGIAGGGLAAAWWVRRFARAPRFLPIVALSAGVFVTLGYAGEKVVLPFLGGQIATTPWNLAVLALPLMLPTALVSGLLFTLLGAALEECGLEPIQAAACLTLANTVGAMCGALVGGLILLPYLGIERSFFLLASVYGLVGALCGVWLRTIEGDRPRLALLGLASAAYAIALALFPFGLMSHYLRVTVSRWTHPEAPGTDILAWREGLTETVIYVRESSWGSPVRYRLLTNAISMSSSDALFSRYMRAFVYLPVALRPDGRRALLISYGVGVTAKALTDTRSLESIDVVDISPDILALGRLVFPAPATPPLADPRVRVHIEDGRFFLLTTGERYDIITAEPPPPNQAGIGNLYSREYFHLIRDRLADGGVATYWLPVYQMALRDSQAITRAFCDAFEDCSLWSGFGPEFILMGTRGARPVEEEGFTRQWRDPEVLSSLRESALERPEYLGTLFLADAPTLAAWTQGVEALDDDHPQRISPTLMPLQSRSYLPLADPPQAAARFAQSAFIRELWPPALRDRTIGAFAGQSPVLRVAWGWYGVQSTDVRDAHDILAGSDERTAVLWLLGLDAALERAALAARKRGLSEPNLDEYLGASALADRDYLRAEAFLARAQAQARFPERVAQYRILALCMAGERERAATVLREVAGGLRPSRIPAWTWLLGSCQLPNVFNLPGYEATTNGG